MRWRKLRRFETHAGLLALAIVVLIWEIAAVSLLYALATLLGGLPLLLYAAGVALLVFPVLYLGSALLDFIYRAYELSEPSNAMARGQGR